MKISHLILVATACLSLIYEIQAQELLSPTLTLYRTEADFFNVVEIESTESFDGFPSPTQPPTIEAHGGITTKIDQVIYRHARGAVGEAGRPIKSWTIDSEYLAAAPVSPPNLLVSDWKDIELYQDVLFEDGESVEGIGFYFIADSVNRPPAGNWHFGIIERGRELVFWDFSYSSTMPSYLGFHSSVGIEEILITDDGVGRRAGWAFDDVSRTEVASKDPIASVYIRAETAEVGDKVRYTYWIINTSTRDGPTLLLDSLVDVGGTNAGAGLGDLTRLPEFSSSCNELTPRSACLFSVDYIVQPGDENPLRSMVEVHYHPVGSTEDVSATASVVTIIPEPHCLPLVVIAALALLGFRGQNRQF